MGYGDYAVPFRVGEGHQKEQEAPHLGWENPSLLTSLEWLGTARKETLASSRTQLPDKALIAERK